MPHAPDRLMTRSRPTTTRYSLVNPHDAYEFDAADDEVADAVCLLLGGGWYGWSRGGTFSEVVGALDEVEQQDRVQLLEGVVADRRREVVAALRSVEIDPDGRREAEDDPELWHQAHRSSFADPRENAIETAADLERS